jgi:uncharacterized membrane protein YfcA
MGPDVPKQGVRILTHDMTMWLVPALAMLAAGLVAGFAAGIFGIGGGFVVVPALMLVLPLLGGDKPSWPMSPSARRRRRSS